MSEQVSNSPSYESSPRLRTFPPSRKDYLPEPGMRLPLLAVSVQHVIFLLITRIPSPG